MRRTVPENGKQRRAKKGSSNVINLRIPKHWNATGSDFGPGVISLAQVQKACQGLPWSRRKAVMAELQHIPKEYAEEQSFIRGFG